MSKSTLKTLAEYIDKKHGGNQSRFARANNVQRAQVSQWIKAGYLVFDNRLLAERRELTNDYFECQRCDFVGVTDDLLDGEACPQCKLI